MNEPAPQPLATCGHPLTSVYSSASSGKQCVFTERPVLLYSKPSTEMQEVLSVAVTDTTTEVSWGGDG